VIYAEAGPGTHPTIDLGCGTLCTFNYDSVISSAIALLATLAVAFWIRSKLREGEPSKVQAVFEWGYDQLRSLIKTNVSDDALFIIPLAMTLFLYILIANWIEILPLAFFPILHGANADLNQTLAMGLIVFFAYFYTAIVFNPVDLADNMKKYGGFIPGVRPGKKTAEYIDRTLTRITLPGALFLALISVLPDFLIRWFNVPFYFGGTSLLIVVGVALDTVRQMESHLLMRNYEGFLKRSRSRSGGFARRV